MPACGLRLERKRIHYAESVNEEVNMGNRDKQKKEQKKPKKPPVPKPKP